MNKDLISTIGLICGSVGTVASLIGWYRERRKRLVLEIELLNMPRGNRRTVTVPADINPERLQEYAISLFTQKRELIDRLYVSDTQRKPLIYSIVLHEDSLDNRQSLYEVLTDLWDASSLDDVHFSFFPPSLRDSLTDLMLVDLQHSSVRQTVDERQPRTKVNPSTPASWLTSTTPLALAIGVGGLGGAISGLRGAAFGIITGLIFGFILLREKRLDKRGNQSNKPTDEHEEQ